MSKKRSREEACLTAEEEAQLLHAGQHTEGGFLHLQVSLILYANIVSEVYFCVYILQCQ